MVPPEHADVDRTVAYWGGAPAVRARLEAVAAAPWSLALFLEYVPFEADGWLVRRFAEGPAAAEAAIEVVAPSLLSTVRAMNRRGLVHFGS